MNRQLLSLLALIELILALLFMVVCLIVFFVQPDSLSLQLLLVFVGLIGLGNGIFLIRQLKKSRAPKVRNTGTRPIANQNAKRKSGKKV